MRIALAVTLLALTAGVASAQMVPPGGAFSGPGSQPNSNQQPQTVPDQPPVRTTKPKPKAPPTKADILRDAAALVKSIHLPCDVSDAALINEGTATVNGKELHVRNFETACSNGMGYFLIEQPPEPTAGFSCFAAERTREVDKAQGRQPGPACTLPANADLKTMAGTILSKLGQSCQVTAVRWIGEETGKNRELTEAACSDGKGFVIASAIPGGTAPVSALSCPESYRHGIACKLSSNGPPLITMQTFKDALAQHNVPCNVENMRVIGKETVKKRHVVEFKCPQQQPDGLVAFIPLEGNKAPFETIDCAQAAKRYRIICTMTPAR